MLFIRLFDLIIVFESYKPHVHTNSDTKSDAGMTCEISAVNKMAARKISLLFLPFSSSTTGPMQERMVKTLLLHFSCVLMSLKFSNLLISWKKSACHHTYEIGFKKKAEYSTEGTSLTFQLKTFPIMIPNFSPCPFLISSPIPEI